MRFDHAVVQAHNTNRPYVHFTTPGAVYLYNLPTGYLYRLNTSGEMRGGFFKHLVEYEKDEGRDIFTLRHREGPKAGTSEIHILPAVTAQPKARLQVQGILEAIYDKRGYTNLGSKPLGEPPFNQRK